MPDYAAMQAEAAAIAASPIGDWRPIEWEGVNGPIHGMGVYRRAPSPDGDPLAKGFCVIIMNLTDNDETRELVQPYCRETYQVGAGSLTLTVGAQVYPLSYGEQHILEPGTPHTIRANGTATLIVVSIPTREGYPDAARECRVCVAEDYGRAD